MVNDSSRRGETTCSRLSYLELKVFPGCMCRLCHTMRGGRREGKRESGASVSDTLVCAISTSVLLYQ